MNATSTSAQAQAELIQTLRQVIPQTVGPSLLGSYLASVFYGVTLLQTYQYFSRYYGRDSIYMCGLVVVLTLLDTFAVVLNMASVWFYVIKNFDNPLALSHINWALSSTVLATATVAFLVQSVYAHRAYILGGRKILIPGIILVCGTAGLVLGVTYSALLLKTNNLLAVPSRASWSTSSLACFFAADVAISVSITWYLLQGRNSIFRNSDTLIRRLVIYTLNTGIITTACTVVTLILGEVLKNTFYNIISYSLVSKCYVNSVLAFLNAREPQRNATNTVVSFQLDSTPTASKLEFQTMANQIFAAANTLASRSGSGSITDFRMDIARTSPTTDFSDP